MAYKFQKGLAVLSGAIAPMADDEFDLGTASKQYKDIYIDGVAYIDTIGSDGDPSTAYIGGGEIDSTIIGSETPAAGTFTDLIANGNVDLGDAATDSISFVGRADSDLLPIADSSHDLGSANLQWAELHVDTAYVDAIDASDSALDVSADSFFFRDSDGSLKRDTMADYATAIAGDGLAASSGVLAVGVDDSSIELNADALRIKADGVTGAMLASAVAGAGLTQDNSGNLDVVAATDGGLVVAANDVSLDIGNLAAAAIASGDTFAFDDSGTTKKETVDDLATLFAGVGLSASSAVMALDLNELNAAAVDVAADSIAIIDADDSNGSRKESIADLVSAMAGAGLTATNGVLSSDASPTPNDLGDANGNLTEGMNWSSATFTAVRTWTLPASPDAGDVVSVKAPSNAASNALIVSKAGSQTIDGSNTVVLASGNAAVEFVYVGSDKWLIK